MAADTLTPVILQVVQVLERLDVPYLIGGSIASMMYGVVRTTLDADIIADLRDDQVEPFVTALADEFYVDAGSIHDAIQRRRCFNIIHLATMFKIDIFIPDWDDYLREEFRRRERLALASLPEQMVHVASIEDTILTKLVWYRLGGHVSERQWRDACEVIKIHRDRLDLPYLNHWAAVLQVQELLRQALRDT
ncbi:MAG: hypothetical protein ACYC7E_05705 [Armatimonadota bacterium]